eukprot:PLAT10471.1.p3 GENE.PLAT10471.1~~PLAT10471.1.p3  ORF type:complete len:152 (+),score=46.68 PLAT10471.1:22-456(+)
MALILHPTLARPLCDDDDGVDECKSEPLALRTPFDVQDILHIVIDCLKPEELATARLVSHCFRKATMRESTWRVACLQRFGVCREELKHAPDSSFELYALLAERWSEVVSVGMRQQAQLEALRSLRMPVEVAMRLPLFAGAARA